MVSRASVVVVHCVGPVEIEKAGTERVRCQRCLRCDLLLWSARPDQVGYSFVIGENVYIENDQVIETGTLLVREWEEPCSSAYR